MAMPAAAFEVQLGVKIPATREELLQSWADGRVQTFYHDLCEKCHR